MHAWIFDSDPLSSPILYSLPFRVPLPYSVLPKLSHPRLSFPICPPPSALSCLYPLCPCPYYPLSYHLDTNHCGRLSEHGRPLYIPMGSLVLEEGSLDERLCVTKGGSIYGVSRVSKDYRRDGKRDSYSGSTAL